MKNRKTVIAVFVLLAAMLVGVGFAAITGSLTIEGTASSSAQKFNVVFTGAHVDAIWDEANDNAVPALSIQNNKVKQNDDVAIANLFTVSMTATGLAVTEDYVTVTYTILNNNKVDMLLTPTVTGANIFRVTGGFADGVDEGTELDATTTVAAGGTTTYTVTVRLAADDYDVTQSETFTITIAGESVTD